MAKTIPVTDLRIGMIIKEEGGMHDIKIKSLTPCTTRAKVHVNDTMCYDYCCTVEVSGR